jgi:hypothetical protein
MNDWEKCTTCEHAIFHETWGEIKCQKLFIRIYAPRAICKHYKKREINKNDKT